MKLLYFIVTTLGLIIFISFILSNLSVSKANRYFYEELLKRAYTKDEAKTIMADENRAYQSRVKAGARGLSLSQHLNEMIDNY